MYVVATVIFIELIVEFRYRFLYSPNYPNKLIKGIKNYLDVGTTLYSVLFDMFNKLVNLV
jgi:hypothetical protein